MALIDINWNPSRKELRVFALLQVIFFAIVAWILHGRLGATPVAVGLVTISAALAVVGLVWPSFLNPVYVAWMAAAFPIGWVVSHSLMAIIFYLLITPIGLAMRLLGRDPLERNRDPDANTYWKTREAPSDTRRYFRQF